MRLILTADDFGRSSDINAAVLEAHRSGVLTSASLMVGGDAFGEAVEIARRTPTLAVGLHLVVIDGAPVLPADRLSRIVDSAGRFPDAPARLGMRYYFDRRARAQLHDEIRAQFSRFSETGLKLAHVDGHQHMHLHPAVFPLLISLAREYGAAGIRLPRDNLRFALSYSRKHMLLKTAWAIALGLMSWRCRWQLRNEPLAVAERVYGLMQTGEMKERYVLKLLRHITGESAEIYFHPTRGPRLNNFGPNPDELKTLLSVAVKEAIAESGMQLGTYPDLLRGAR